MLTIVPRAKTGEEIPCGSWTVVAFCHLFVLSQLMSYQSQLMIYLFYGGGGPSTLAEIPALIADSPELSE